MEYIAGLLQLLMGVRTHVIAAEQHGADLSTAAMEVVRQVFCELLLTATERGYAIINIEFSFCSQELVHSKYTIFGLSIAEYR